MAGRKTTNNLDNNLDALLDDLQTSINTSGSNTTTRQHHVSSSSSAPQHSTTRIIETSRSSRQSPLRSMSPARHTTSSPRSGAREVTVEKYVSTGPAGTASGIPGLEMLDKELADVQPGQSKTVAYKQVSYHYDKSQEGKDLEPWMKTDKITRNDSSIVDDFCERTFNQTSSSRPIRDVTDYGKTNQEIVYKADVSSRTVPVVHPVTTENRSTERDFKYVKETSYHTEPSPISPRKNIKTVRTDETEELTNVEYIPSSTPLPINIPEPGPNTKVTTTIKTYTYEVPRTPVVTHTTTTSNTSTLNKNVEKSISYSTSSLPREHVPEKTVVHHIEEHQRGGVREYIPAPSPTTSRVHREQKVYMEERRGYRAPSPPPPVSTTSTITRSEKYLQESRGTNGYGPPPGVDYPDHAVSRTTERVVYSSEPPARPVETTSGNSTTRTVKQYEEHYASRPPKPVYYPSNESHSSTTVYKQYEESLMPKPFPTSERPVSPRQEPPKRIDDLMSSFSESKEVVEVMEKRSDERKGVDFAPHSPPVVRSRNVAGPPVYYPPGSAEFQKKEQHMVSMSAKGGGEGWHKEESMSAMSKRGGGWEKERAAWEYGGSEKHEEKTKSKKAVVPMCLPLCCALPCSIM